MQSHCQLTERPKDSTKLSEMKKKIKNFAPKVYQELEGRGNYSGTNRLPFMLKGK